MEKNRCILLFSRTISHFQGQFYKIPGQKWHYFEIPGVFQDQGQIQGLFQVCANPECCRSAERSNLELHCLQFFCINLVASLCGRTSLFKLWIDGNKFQLCHKIKENFGITTYLRIIVGVKFHRHRGSLW